MNLAPFTCDVTPPIGHPLCGGWIAPAREVVDRQFAHGVVIQPDGGDAIVLCAVDWCWIRGTAHESWREVVADALGTQPNRVAIQCVHQHDAIMADPAADRILEKEKFDLRTLKGDFFNDVIKRCAAAAKESLRNLQPVTHIGTAQAKVDKVASNRRILGPDGKVGKMRGSACTDPTLRARPEGLVDPWLKCVSFWNGDNPIAALHYYATHPMSYYGKGGVSADFVGLARERLRGEQPRVPLLSSSASRPAALLESSGTRHTTRTAHIYFTGCAGNVAAGKYNDGSPGVRPILAQRIYTAMKEAFTATKRQPVESVAWNTEPIHLPMSEEFTREAFTKRMRAPQASAADRIKGAMGLSWWDWFEAGKKIDLTALRVNNVHILHLPGEPFVEYQLAAQEIRTRHASAGPGFIAVAGYGDCGPAYIPVAAAYPQGGYEVSMAWVGPKSENVIKRVMQKLVGA